MSLSRIEIETAQHYIEREEAQLIRMPKRIALSLCELALKQVDDARVIPIPRERLEAWKTMLPRYWFSDADGESYNNDEVIAMSDEIDKLLASAPKPETPESV